jgi:hypothetical protein
VRQNRERRNTRVAIDDGAGCRSGAGGVTVDVRSRSPVSFSFPYPTGATEEMDADTVIKNELL